MKLSLTLGYPFPHIDQNRDDEGSESMIGLLVLWSAHATGSGCRQLKVEHTSSSLRSLSA